MSGRRLKKRPPSVPVTLRGPTDADEAHLLAWYERDRKGLEQLMGLELPSKEVFAQQFQRVIAMVQEYTARLLMAELKDETIGLVLVTDLPENLEVGRVHIYVTPPKRRYAFRVAEAGLAEATKMGMQRVVQTVQAANKGAVRMSEKLGFKPSPVKTYIKELR